MNDRVDSPLSRFWGGIQQYTNPPLVLIDSEGGCFLCWMLTVEGAGSWGKYKLFLSGYVNKEREGGG